MVDSAREVCGSVRMEGKNPKNVWWNDVVKDAVERKDAARRVVLGKRNEVAKERSMEVYKQEKLKYVLIRAKRRGMNCLEHDSGCRWE